MERPEYTGPIVDDTVDTNRWDRVPPRDGDIIVVSPSARVRRGDRVVVKTIGGEVMAKILKRQSATELELSSFNPEHPGRVVPVRDLAWMARIMWASQ